MGCAVGSVIYWNLLQQDLLFFAQVRKMLMTSSYIP
jgi:hypothetical protein